jgi:hypothetical protein
MIQRGSSPNYWYECHHDPSILTQQTNEWRHVAQADWCGDWNSQLPPPPPGTLPAVSRVIATDVAATNSAVGIMMGFGSTFTITPVKTGRIACIIGGCCANDTANGGLNISGWQGTGTPPAYGAAPGGTAFADTQKYYMQAAKDVSGFTIIGGAVGLTLNTAYWFDLSIAAIGGGNASVTDVQCLIWEL